VSQRPPVRINLEARAANAEYRRALTRKRLIETALGVVAEKGPAVPSVEEFASAAGVSRGTFYNYFDTPDALIAELRHGLLTTAQAQIGQAMEISGDPAIRTALILRYFLRLAEDNPAQASVLLYIEDIHGSREPPLRKGFEGVLMSGVETGRFRPVDPVAARTLIFGAMRLGMRDILHDAAPPGHGARVVAMILAALGLPAAEADLIADRVIGAPSERET
jgi:AcrR family transcriptional regulator